MSTEPCSSKKYSAYPEYKDSGVALLVLIPSHWAITRIKHVSELTPKKPDINRELKCSFLPMEKLKTDSIVLDEVRSISDVYDGYTYFADEDILMAKVTPCFENKNIAVAEGLVNQLGFGSSEIYVLRTNLKAINRYLFYRLQEDGFMDVATAAMTGAGGLKRVPSDTVNNFITAIPCIDEQHKIAKFLDHETAKIDTLIEKQQQLIKLLNEKRQAVISHAVTKGLNPDAPMKDSGVEWLGEIPLHWGVAAISSLSNKITNGYVGPTRDIFHNHGIRYLQSLHIKNNAIDFHTPYFVSNEWSLSKEKSILKEGDVLVVQTGDIGQVAAVPKEYEGCNCHALIIITTTHELSGFYLSWVLNSDYGFHSLKSIQTGALHPHLNCNYVKTLKIPIPSILEQEQIIDFINAANHKYDNLISKATSQVELLKERRTALISAAVTGKIDVRNWTPKAEQDQANAS